ncbi:MAG: AraC family transcriptional regulator [Candidatus Kapaibacterium sp.]
MHLYIRSMVSLRCKQVVIAELDKLGLHYTSVDLGDVTLDAMLSISERQQLSIALQRSGLELMEDRRNILVERIKKVIIESIHYSTEALKINFSDHLSIKLNYDYTYLANVFSDVEHNTIEHFIIAHKIERVKELLVYDELTLTQIAYTLHYSSVSHLSNQFRKVTGHTPSEFKHSKEKRTDMLEEIGDFERSIQPQRTGSEESKIAH